MGLVLRHVQSRPNGSLRYRRSVPKALRVLIGKTEIVHPLGSTVADAVRKYPSVHAATERVLREAARVRSDPRPASMSPLEEHQLMLRRLLGRLNSSGVDLSADIADPDEELGTISGELGHRQQLADGILDAYPVHPVTGDPVGVSPEDVALVRAMHSGVLPPPPPPTLTDAATLYIGERVKPDERKKRQRIERVLGYAKAALGGDRRLDAIRRTDAMLIRDHLRDKLGVAPTTARRYLIDIKAMLRLAAHTYELEAWDPFKGVLVEVPGHRRDDRRSLTDAEADAVGARLRAHARRRPELSLIWTILAYTGCRLAEITGIPKADIAIDGEAVPHLKIVFSDGRRLKNRASERDMPLVPPAALAVRDAIALAGKGPHLFPRYAHGSDAVSAALMRHVRKVTTDPKATVHSLRHRLADRMALAGVSSDAQELILGHSGKTYGSARFAMMAEGLAKTFPSPALGAPPT